MSNNILYLDSDGLNALHKEIEELELAIRNANKGRRAAFEAGSREDYDLLELDDVERYVGMLEELLRKRRADLSRVVIVEKQNNDNIIDIGDVVVVDISKGEEKAVEKTFKLVGGNGNLFEEIPEISLNSPVGSAIYGKKVGDLCTYIVNKNVFSLLIKSKLDLEPDLEGPTR